MTLQAHIRRVWPGPKRTEIIITMPFAIRRILGGWNYERHCYVWNQGKGQWIASLCERACESKQSVNLELEHGDYGWLILSAQFADKQVSA